MAEKKEIGKLIELLNEFYKEKGDIFRAIQHNDRLKVFELENDDLVRDAAIISKEYGFIEWLVENDKIDLGEKLFNLTKNDNRKSIICDLDNNDFSWEDTFLMLLSISSSPIEDLISYLK